MSGYVEVMVRGNCRAYIQAGQIAGVLTPPGFDGQTPGTPDASLAIIMNSGETLHGVYGISANRLILNAEGIKAIVRRTGRLVQVAYLENQDAFEAELSQLLGESMDGDSG